MSSIADAAPTVGAPTVRVVATPFELSRTENIAATTSEWQVVLEGFLAIAPKYDSSLTMLAIARGERQIPNAEWADIQNQFRFKHPSVLPGNREDWFHRDIGDWLAGALSPQSRDHVPRSQTVGSTLLASP